MPTRIVFFGNERLATGVTTKTPVLTGLVAAGYEVVGIITTNSAQRSRKQRDLEIMVEAKRLGISVHTPGNTEELISIITDKQPDIGVLVAYGKFIPQSVINLFPHGIINLHPSLLPQHRGSTPIESVLLDGSVSTGISIMQLVREMDAGPVWQQKSVTIEPGASKQSLADSLGQIGSDMIIEELPQIIEGIKTPAIQPKTGVTSDPRINKSSAILDFQKPAAQLANEVRAYLGWPGSKTIIAGREVIIISCHCVSGTNLRPGEIKIMNTELVIGTTHGLLAIDTLKPAGKTEMSASSFVAGIPELR